MIDKSTTAAGLMPQANHAMPKRLVIALLMAIIITVSQSWTADAHQPRLVCGDPVTVVDPEVSKAYYATLSGAPHTYIIESQKPFLLYLNILVPASSNPQGKYSAIVYRVDAGVRVEFARLDADSVDWKEFYEEYGGDYYLWGPEYEATVPEGRYEVEVFGNDNQGKYVLATGKVEDFPPVEIARTLLVLPVLKVQFFQYPPLVLLSNPIVIAWLIAIVILLSAIVFFTIKILHKRSIRPPH
ncbi:MAG: hypothetical protein PHU70_05335 [Dehalococcoidia bacterium]|nr:hypothetical protein [Dehalococcoidia bacterium]MDD5648451.1 hypothetical protein [Dehalococcoidia bacterium]